MKIHQYIFIATIILIYFFGCVPEKSKPMEPDLNTDPVNSEATNWIIDNSIKITTVNSTPNNLDLMPLQNIIGNAKIVGIGEATFGTHECASMKLRLIDFLVKEMGFNIIVFGSDFPESKSINHFVNTGNGDVNELLWYIMYWRGGYGQVLNNNLFWISQEVADLVNWIYKYNQFKPDELKVNFYGFGVQRPQKAMLDVIEYVENIDSTMAQFVKSNYDRFQKFCWRYPLVNRYVSNDCRDRTTAVRDTIEKLRNIYEPITSTEEYENILFLANYIIRSEQVLRKGRIDLENQYRYEMIKHIIESSDLNSKFIIWGQNNNVGNNPNKYGEYLKNEYGSDYISIGFSIYSGYFYGSVLNPDDGSYSMPCLFEAPEPPEDSYERYFKSSELPYFILDIHSNLEPSGSPATDWLNESHRFNSIGMFYEPDKPGKYFQTTSIRDLYDLIVFIEEISKSELFIY